MTIVAPTDSDHMSWCSLTLLSFVDMRYYRFLRMTKRQLLVQRMVRVLVKSELRDQHFSLSILVDRRQQLSRLMKMAISGMKSYPFGMKH